jgi:hypothetical protein
MILAWLTAKYGKGLVALAAFVIALLVAGGLFYLGFRAIERMQDKAVKTAVALNNAEWQAQIQAANAKAQVERDAQARAAEQASRQAAEEISRLNDSLAKKEARNAELPNPDACGLDADRVRLLNEK